MPYWPILCPYYVMLCHTKSILCQTVSHYTIIRHTMSDCTIIWHTLSYFAIQNHQYTRLCHIQLISLHMYYILGMVQLYSIFVRLGELQHKGPATLAFYLFCLSINYEPLKIFDNSSCRKHTWVAYMLFLSRVFNEHFFIVVFVFVFDFARRSPRFNMQINLKQFRLLLTDELIQRRECCWRSDALPSPLPCCHLHWYLPLPQAARLLVIYFSAGSSRWAVSGETRAAAK